MNITNTSPVNLKFERERGGGSFKKNNQKNAKCKIYFRMGWMER